MFKSVFTRPILLGVALIGSTLSAVIQPAAAQMRLNSLPPLSPAAQQTLSAVVSGFPVADQPLVLNAMYLLGPRAEDLLAQVRAMPAPTAQVFGTMILQALQFLPTEYHQTFINGLFQVSAPEAQFTNQILTQIGEPTVRTYDTGAGTFAEGQVPKRWADDLTICSLGASTSYCGPYAPYYPW